MDTAICNQVINPIAIAFNFLHRELKWQDCLPPNPLLKDIQTKSPDQISDAVLDAILEQDPKARVACETFVKPAWCWLVVKSPLLHGLISKNWRKTVCDIGYTHSDMVLTRILRRIECYR